MMTMDGLARDCGQFTMIHDSNCHPTEWNQTVTNSNAAHWRWARGLTRSIKVQFWICFVFFSAFLVLSLHWALVAGIWVFEGHIMIVASQRFNGYEGRRRRRRRAFCLSSFEPTDLPRSKTIRQEDGQERWRGNIMAKQQNRAEQDHRGKNGK